MAGVAPISSNNPADTEAPLNASGLPSPEMETVIGSAPDDLILEAARACPAMAIEVVDADTGEPVDV